MARRKNIIKNFIANFFNVSVIVILSFAVRTVFIQSVENDYLVLMDYLPIFYH